ncbi:hypothetical protein PISMIDRAFT_333378 [Pisolithus microcarpus 441]|uniref:Uncharacterized protein n=1 Tax=Pisolithus microcarpus 441 TaxID=765257 RepID=A0A0C9ZTU2_9AGAM|nr:hypothetical protein PISMIDRAFT_333378 [Pisolithus microcarpus 441]
MHPFKCRAETKTTAVVLDGVKRSVISSVGVCVGLQAVPVRAQNSPLTSTAHCTRRCRRYGTLIHVVGTNSA